MADCQGKKSWPELVGVNGDAAARVIERENPNVDAIVLKEGTPVTKDFRCNRVWVWVDDHRVVTRTPQIGKHSWPELVGTKGDNAALVIESENSKVQAIIILEVSSIPLDFNCGCVWVVVNENGIVVQVPVVG